jgi:hypothetical protein
MTATGIALIAGGLATLIGFRRVLWPGRGATARRPARIRGIEAARRPARRRAIEAARRPELRPGPADGRPSALLPAQASAPDISGAHLASTTAPEAAGRIRRHGRGGRAGLAGPDVQQDEDERAGLASIGLADEEAPESAEDDVHEYDEPPEQDGPEDVDDADSAAGRSGGESDPPTGDYWMPVPESAYADLDRWPVRGDRDPAGSQPTAIVPVWPPARPFDRIELPRTWSEGAGPNPRPLRETAGRGRQVNEEVVVRHWEQLDWDGRDGWRRSSGPEDHPDAAPRRRPRPRPNPAAEARSTVYVSRHAAE